jgi:sulfate transport system permease protein
LALGFSLTYLSLIVLIPLAGLVMKTSSLGWDEFWKIATDGRTLAALRVSFGLSLPAAALNAVFGLSWPGCSSATSFPGAVSLTPSSTCRLRCPPPPALRLSALLAQRLDRPSHRAARPKIAYAKGIFIALVFIGLPFIVRTLQPVLEDMSREAEEAAATLGATRRQTFVRVVLPVLLPALLTGFALALVCAVGEYGSVISSPATFPSYPRSRRCSSSSG